MMRSSNVTNNLRERRERRKGMFGHQSGFRDRAFFYPAVEERVTWEVSVEGS